MLSEADYQRRSKGKMAILNENITRFHKENSRMLPGKRTVKKGGVQKQLMYLNDSVASLYKNFRDTTPC